MAVILLPTTNPPPIPTPPTTSNAPLFVLFERTNELTFIPLLDTQLAKPSYNQLIYGLDVDPICNPELAAANADVLPVDNVIIASPLVILVASIIVCVPSTYKFPAILTSLPAYNIPVIVVIPDTTNEVALTLANVDGPYTLKS